MNAPPLELLIDGNELHERVQADLAARFARLKERQIMECLFGPRSLNSQPSTFNCAETAFVSSHETARDPREGTVQRVSLPVQRGDRRDGGLGAQRVAECPVR